MAEGGLGQACSAHLRDLVGEIPSPDEVSGLSCPRDCSFDSSALFVMVGPPAKVIIFLFQFQKTCLKAQNLQLSPPPFATYPKILGSIPCGNMQVVSVHYFLNYA